MENFGNSKSVDLQRLIISLSPSARKTLQKNQITSLKIPSLAEEGGYNSILFHTFEGLFEKVNQQAFSKA